MLVCERRKTEAPPKSLQEKKEKRKEYCLGKEHNLSNVFITIIVDV